MGSVTKKHTFVGGRLISNPTNFALPATDCGGTVLGTVQNASLEITYKQDPITGEEFGSDLIDTVILGAEVVFKCHMSGWDKDFISNLFGGSGLTSVANMDFPLAFGVLGATLDSPTLLWLPNDETAEPAVVIWNAIPWDLPKELFFSARRELTVTATFMAVRDSTNRVANVRLLSALPSV